MGVRWRAEGRAHVRRGRRPSSRGDRRAGAAGDVHDISASSIASRWALRRTHACACSTISGGGFTRTGAATPKTATRSAPAPDTGPLRFCAYRT
jgi:hypothetical protein